MMGDDRADLKVADLAVADLHGSLQDATLTSMNLLNEVAARYPEAVSFAAGRPFEEFFDVASLHRYLDTFCRYLSDELGYSDSEVRRTLFQYGRTKGILHHLISRQLMLDEKIDVDPEAVVVTVGCQEAMFLVLRALRSSERDVLLSVAPMYVGLTGAARLVDMPVLSVASGTTGVDTDDLVAQVRAARRAGLRPRACYVMPDFANPSGASLDLASRRDLLDLAEQEDLLLLEDNPYGMFYGDVRRVPTLKSLDARRRVVYLGSFAKTALPGARIGYVLADQRVSDGHGEEGLFADQLSKVKSMVTVNTSPVAQAVVGGKLLEHDCSLERATVREREVYRRNLRHIVSGLEARLRGRVDVSWNVPTGGFFVVVTVPFVVDDQLLDYSARRYGVLWTPMYHFYDGGGGRHQLRLSCSALTEDQIEQGLDRLAAFVVDCADCPDTTVKVD